MTVYEFLKKDNTIEKLFNSGVITFDKKCHFIYVDNVYEMMKKGIAKTEAVRETSIKCKVSVPTVWRALSVFKVQL